MSADQQDDQTAAPTPEPVDSDDVQRKFREALERKRGKRTNAGLGGEGKAGSKVRDTHGPAHTQRTFRRKSGA